MVFRENVFPFKDMQDPTEIPLPLFSLFLKEIGCSQVPS